MAQMTITMKQKQVARLVGACSTHRISVIALCIETHTHTKCLARNSTAKDGGQFWGITLKLQFF